MHYKLFEQADIKINNDGPGTISGYGSTFKNWDRVGEKPAPGAFTPFLPALIRDGFMAIGHDWKALPIATFSDVHEDDHGLHFEAEFHSTTMAQEARVTANERLARGKSVMTSIGYDDPETKTVDAPELKSHRGTLLTLVPVHEISLVTVPANPLALISSAKDWLPAGLSMDDQGEAALATVRALLARAKSLQELRAKEGRRLSAATTTQLQSVLDTLKELLGLEMATENDDDDGSPAAQSDEMSAQAPTLTVYDNAEAIKQYALYLRDVAISNGVRL